MRTLLKPIDPRLLTHTVTVFNDLGRSARKQEAGYMAAVIRKVSLSEGNIYNFNQSGNCAASPFRVVMCCANSDFNSRRFVPVLEWIRLSQTERQNGRFTLHRDMWLITGEHPDIPDGAVIPAAHMNARHFSELGARLVKTTGFTISGLDKAHHFTLEG